MCGVEFAGCVDGGSVEVDGGTVGEGGSLVGAIATMLQGFLSWLMH